MGSTVINCDADTKAAVASYAAERGISQTKALAELVAEAAASRADKAFTMYLGDNVADDLVVNRVYGVQTHQRLRDMARERSQSPAETLSAALDALAKPTGIVTPQPRTEPVWEGGVTPCRCDGPETVGSHHRTGCHNRRDQ